MLNDATGFRKVYIATGYTDLLLGIDGLATIINLTSSWILMKKLSFFCSVEDAVTGSKDLCGKVAGFFSYIKVPPVSIEEKRFIHNYLLSYGENDEVCFCAARVCFYFEIQ